MSSSDQTEKSKPSTREILRKAGKRALGGGIPGAAAMAAQVVTLMPLRSTMNYQYRYGNTTTATAIRTLYADGGIRRFYRGIGPALFQGPLSRFGDTAANSGILTLLDSYDSTKSLPVGVKTAAASGCAAAWRIFLMRKFPCNTFTTCEQIFRYVSLHRTLLRIQLFTDISTQSTRLFACHSCGRYENHVASGGGERSAGSAAAHCGRRSDRSIPRRNRYVYCDSCRSVSFSAFSRVSSLRALALIDATIIPLTLTLRFC